MFTSIHTFIAFTVNQHLDTVALVNKVADRMQALRLEFHTWVTMPETLQVGNLCGLVEEANLESELWLEIGFGWNDSQLSR